MIGGGPIVSALKNHLKKGFSIFIEKNAAKTIRDDLREVTDLGFDVVEAVENPDITLSEIDFQLIKNLLNIYGDYDLDYHIAVQDHGYIQGQSDRVTRMNFLENFLKNGLKGAFFSSNNKIETTFSRFNCIYNTLSQNGIKNFSITDTAIIAALGAVYNNKKWPVVTVDIGNGHTFACLVDKDYKVLGFFEHHTKMLTPEKFKYFINKLIDGSITNEEVYDDKGHGAKIFKPYSYKNLPILSTGPQRRSLVNEEGEISFASPLGDMMITGPVGIFMQQNLL